MTDENILDIGELCKRLLAAGVYIVSVNYSGSGDSGDVEQPEFFDNHGRSIPLKVGGALGELDDLVSNYVCESLPAGWEINEGSHGSVDIDVLNGLAEFDHYDRIETSEHNPFSDRASGEEFEEQHDD